MTMPNTDDQVAVDIIFKGLERPKKVSETYEAILSAVAFLQQFAAIDKLVGVALADNVEVVTSKAQEQWLKNWQSLNMLLFDYGYELNDDAMFAILARRLDVAAQLSNDIQRLNDKTHARQVLKSVGPPVPVRQRVHPFLPTYAAPTAANATLKTAAHAIGTQATRMFLQDQPRFSKKRAISVDNLERLKDKEFKMMKLKEKKEREAQQKAQEAQRNQQAAQSRSDQDQFIAETYRADPDKMAEKSKRTELLRELERLENDYTSDERRIATLKRDTAPESPRSKVNPQHSSLAQTSLAHAAMAGKLSSVAPVKLRETTAIPFSSSPSGVAKQPTKSAAKKR